MTNEELAELERLLAEIDGKKKGQLTSLCLAYERLGRIVSRDRDYWIATAREAEALRAENARLRVGLDRIYMEDRRIVERWRQSLATGDSHLDERIVLGRYAEIARAALEQGEAAS